MRSRLFIDPRVQVPVAATMAAAGLVMATIHFASMRAAVDGVESGLVLQMRSPAFIVAFVLVTVVGLGWLGTLVTYRIVRPSREIRRTLDHYMAGDLAVRTSVGDTDALCELAVAVDELGDHLQHERAEMIDELRAAIATGSTAHLMHLLARLEGDVMLN